MKKAGLTLAGVTVIATALLIIFNQPTELAVTLSEVEASSATQTESTSSADLGSSDESHQTEDNKNIQFQPLTLDELSNLTNLDMEIYLADFRWSLQHQADFDRLENDLLMKIFEIRPEVTLRYVSDYIRATEDAQLAPPAIVTSLMHQTPETKLKEAFYQFVDAYQTLPVTWYVARALQTELSEFYDSGNSANVPSILPTYALQSFMEGNVNHYPIASLLSEPGTLSHEQLVDVFLRTSPQTIEDGLNDLLFDVIKLNDARTYEHLLSFLQHHPKKLNLYRQLKGNEQIELSQKVDEMMHQFQRLTEEDKVYFSLMALDAGNKKALSYLLENPVRDYDGPVEVNIEFAIKRILTTPSGTANKIDWAKTHFDDLTFNPMTSKFSL